MNLRLHPREQIVKRASLDSSRKIMAWHNEYGGDLTDGETLATISDVLGGEVATLAKYMIRAERHPGNPDTPGGLE